MKRSHTSLRPTEFIIRILPPVYFQARKRALLQIQTLEEMVSTQSAKNIFNDYLDGEASMDEVDGRLEHIRDYRKLFVLRWNIKNKNYQVVQSTLPASKVTDDTASHILLKLCSIGDVQVLHMAVLVHFGANINYKEEKNMTPLHYLAQSLSGPVCNYALLCGSNCDVVESTNERTPLIFASMPAIRSALSKQLETVDVLLATHPTTLDHIDSDGHTALDYALQARNVYLVRRLLAAGCSVMKTNFYRIKKLANAVENTPNKLECIDYRVSDRWLYFQLLLVSKEVLCQQLANYRLREEFAAQQRAKLNTAFTENDTLHHHQPENNRKMRENTDSVDVSALEARKEHRRKHRETKNQQRVAREQQAAEAEREKKREQYMKRVEKEYHVSFKGLFT